LLFLSNFRRSNRTTKITQILTLYQEKSASCDEVQLFITCT